MKDIDVAQFSSSTTTGMAGAGGPGSATSPKEKRGCFFYGCLTTFIVMILLVLGAYFAFQSITTRFIEAYTADFPAPIQEVPASPDLLVSARQKMDLLTDRTSSDTAPIELTDEEVTVLVANSELARQLGAKIRIRFEPSAALADVSIPLEPLGHPGRYFNGSAVFDLTLQDSLINVQVKDVTVGREPVPSDVLEKIRSRNILNDELEKQGRYGRSRKFERLELQSGKLVFFPQQSTPVPDPVIPSNVS
ncbi:MAG: hypothetical protein IT290_07940 [Deltaproteobacteria bacterium]|nr:hypothetical protein [Deltaproteobacteria bacterium]